MRGTKPRRRCRMDSRDGDADTRRKDEMERHGLMQQDVRRISTPREKSGVAAGRVRLRRGRLRVDARQTRRLMTSVPFVPPNPNEFFSATSIFMSRAVFAQ